MRTHCRAGHPLVGSNLKATSGGGWRCRLCSNRHALAYAARRRLGITLQPKNRSLAERFESLVNRDGPTVSEDLGPCSIWLGAKTFGYGIFKMDGRSIRAHRLAFFLATGRWPVQLLHRCDSRSCVRIDHLAEGTQRDNIHDMMRKGRAGGLAIRTKLTPALVTAIRSAHSMGAPYFDLAQRYGVSRSAIQRACLRKSWAYIP